MNQPTQRRIFFLLPLLAVLFFFFYSCQREIDGGSNNNTSQNVNDAIMVTGGINGILVDENNLPVEGATVTSGTASTTTDRYGAFRFRNISLSKANATVKITRNGYFNAYRTFPATQGRIHNLRIKLIPKTNSGSFSASTGGTVTITGGGKLQMPANAITDAGGTAYTGTVNVAMAWIDPSGADLPYTLMGDLRGISSAGEERGLSTFGMLGVELSSSTGQPLKIASGKTAELTFPIPASLQSVAPASIDLWHFDEATARWKQEGTAVKSGTNYIATVSHFSFWNCDAPFPLIDLCLSLKDNDNNPLVNVQVRIKRVVNGTYGYGRTDSTGSLCGKVPKDEALVLEVLDLCNNPVYSSNIGPFSTATTLPPITVAIPATSMLHITGNITNCAGTNVTNGAAAIYVAGGNHYTIPVTNGFFDLSLVRCSSGTVNFTVLGVDYSTLQQSIPVTGSGTTGIVNLGNIQACGTTAAQYVSLLIDGVPENFVSPPDSMYSYSSSGTPPYANKTNINASKIFAGGFNQVLIGINDNTVPGTYPLAYFTLNLNQTQYSFVPPAPNVTVTTYGAPVSGFIEGTVSGQISSGTGSPKNLNCTFRVRRN